MLLAYLRPALAVSPHAQLAFYAESALSIGHLTSGQPTPGFG